VIRLRGARGVNGDAADWAGVTQSAVTRDGSSSAPQIGHW
jgi:hypothetical protein